VKEVEQTKGKCGARSFPGGREPPNPEQLDTWRNAGAIRITFAICNVDRVDASHVKQRQWDRGGGHVALDSVVVAKVKDGAKVFDRYTLKMGSSPTLRKISACVNWGQNGLPGSDETARGSGAIEGILDKRGTRRSSRCSEARHEVLHIERIVGDTSEGEMTPAGCIPPEIHLDVEAIPPAVSVNRVRRRNGCRKGGN
jgi:hypothetical protein